jgi:hypothetical protein
VVRDIEEGGKMVRNLGERIEQLHASLTDQLMQTKSAAEILGAGQTAMLKQLVHEYLTKVDDPTVNAAREEFSQIVTLGDAPAVLGQMSTYFREREAHHENYHVED